MTSAYVPSGESIVLSIKPALRSIVLRSLPTMLVCALLAVVAHYGLPPLDAGPWRDDVIAWLAIVAGARVLWECAVWASRRYVLTSKRVISISGVFHRQIRDLPLERVQNAVLDRTLMERIFVLGTIGVASAGSAWIDVAWVMIADSPRRLQVVRDAVRSRTAGGARGAGMGDPDETQLEARSEAPAKALPGAPSAAQDEQPVALPDRPLIIGLAGGIGAGKSAVAGRLAELGCIVIDSDALAKKELDDPEVARALREWWGDGVIDGSGRVDRSRVAEIVFADPEQRRRLESLIHPRVRVARDRLIAQHRGARAVVIDAPLLFEAGIDAECDAVLFVHAPRDARLARLVETRGWDEAELARREASQWPVERKRAASDLAIDNSGAPGALGERVREALERIEGWESAKKPPN